MEKTISVGGKDVRMRASALIPRLYRYKFRRDMIADMRKLEKDFKKATNLPEDATEEEIRQAQSNNGNSGAVSSADELKKYKELLDSGVITQEEFDAKKKQLLGL